MYVWFMLLRPYIAQGVCQHYYCFVGAEVTATMWGWLALTSAAIEVS